MSRRVWLFALLIVAAAAAIELANGRHPICTCGTIDLWVGARDSPKTSQMLLDWYSLSHVVHGLLLYALFWLLARRWPVQWRFLAALLIEASWEAIENMPFVINRYRATTASLGYSGDSILNSMSDVAMMAIGFLLARRLPVWAGLLLLVALELIPLFLIRDNLALNVWQLLAPSKTLEAWQAAR